MFAWIFSSVGVFGDPIEELMLIVMCVCLDFLKENEKGSYGGTDADCTYMHAELSIYNFYIILIL